MRGRACEHAREELDANGLRISPGGGAPRGRVGLVAAVARHEEEAQPHLLRPPLDELDLEAESLAEGRRGAPEGWRGVVGQQLRCTGTNNTDGLLCEGQ